MQRYSEWIIGQALPLWADIGFDEKDGRFVERLDRNGRTLAVPHRAMVQARQIYVYAHAASLGWFPEGGRLAEIAMRSLRRDYLDDDGRSGCAFSINPNSRTICSDTRDSYTHAFVLFAIARLYALTREPGLLHLAEYVVAFVEERLFDSVYGGVMDSLGAGSAHKRQNPQMHLLEAYLAFEDAAPGHGYAERAEALVALFYQRMLSLEGVLREYFSESWGPHPEPARRDLFEPGHHYEWAWLLRQHERLAGSSHLAVRRVLVEIATQHGVSPAGALYDEVKAGGMITKSSFRLWPHTEAIKAATALHEDGDNEAHGFAQRMCDALFAHFLGRPFAGGWTDQLHPDLSPLVDYVPASSLYHLFLAAAEADRVFGRDVAPNHECAVPL